MESDTTSRTLLSEEAILGGMILDPTICGRVDLLGNEFLLPEHGKLYSALVLLHESQFPLRDTRALVIELRDQGLPSDLITVKHIAHLMEYGQPAHWRYHSELIRKYAAVRRLMVTAAELRAKASDPLADPLEISRWLDVQIQTAGVAVSEPKLLVDVARDWLEEQRTPLDRPTVGTGMPEVDQAIGMWRPGELVVVAARPGVGKTALALQVAEWQAARGNTVFFASLEMRDRELCERSLARACGINGKELRQRRANESELNKIERQILAIENDPLYVWSPPAASINQIRAAARRLACKMPLGLIAVDYVGRVKPDDYRIPRHEQISRVTWSCKSLAKECQCPVMLLAQLNRESTKDSEPRLSHLAESGSIEQDADIVLFLHPKEDKTRVKLICAKNRHGTTGALELYWDGRETRFYGETPAAQRANYSADLARFNGDF